MLVKHYAPEEERADCIAPDAAIGVCAAMSALAVHDPEFVPDAIVAAFGGKADIEKACVYRAVSGEWQRSAARTTGLPQKRPCCRSKRPRQVGAGCQLSVRP